MDEQRQRIHDDLRGLIRGELLFDVARRRLYGSDAGWFELDPLGAVCPSGTDDLIALVRYSQEQRIPLHARGAGTSSWGESFGNGLVVDLSQHFRQVMAVEEDTIEVQCGVVVSQLRSRLEPLGRRLACAAGASAVRTVGGLIGRNEPVPDATRGGTIADGIEWLEVVLANGEVATFGGELPNHAENLEEDPALEASIVRHMTTLAGWHGPLIRHASRPDRRLSYDLGQLESDGRLRLARLFAGAHGTLGLVTRARLRTEPVPEHRRVLLIPFGRVTDAATAVPECLAASPHRLELLDWRAIRLARDASPFWRELLPPTCEAVLVVAFEADETESPADRSRWLIGRLDHSGLPAGVIVERARKAECDRLLEIRAEVEPLLMRGRGRLRPMPLFRELYVPPDQLAIALAQFQQLFQKYEVDWMLQGTVGCRRLELRVLVDPADAVERAKLSSLATDVFEAALDRQGGTSGEDARPLIPGPLHRRQLGDLAPIAREIKNIFDPSGQLNPGKTGGDRSALAERPFRRYAITAGAPAPTPQVIQLSFGWGEVEPLEEATACNGCGECRGRETPERMCPAFRALGTEPSSPRGKANAFRLLASGAIDTAGEAADELRLVADLCLDCRMCRKECPSAVDIPGLVREMKAAHTQDRGLSPPDWVLSRLDFWGQLACLVPSLFNGVTSLGPSRWLLERVFGMSRHRRWPRAQRASFLRRAERLGLTRPRPSDPGPRVVYFVDTFATYFDQATAAAVVEVLRHCDVNVFVPLKQKGCGMSALQVGDVDRARELARANLRVLGDAVREGYTIVCSEPTATLMLREDYPRLTDDIDAGLVADSTMDLSAYLHGLDGRGLLPRPEQHLPCRAGYHQPCHQRYLDIGTPSLDLLGLIPGLEVEHVDRGCSGMGGIHGLYRDHFRDSLRSGRPLAKRLSEPDLEIGVTECGACRLQMEQGSTKRTHHPIKLLAMGYGLLPELRARYRLPKGRKEIT